MGFKPNKKKVENDFWFSRLKYDQKTQTAAEKKDNCRRYKVI